MDTYTTTVEQKDFNLLDIINFCTSRDIKITIDKVADYRERKIMITLEGYSNDLEEAQEELSI